MDPDPDPACHFDVVPDSDPIFHIKAQSLLKVLKNRLIFHTFWLAIYKLMRIRIQISTFVGDPDHGDTDSDPTFQFNADPDPQLWLKGGACYTCSYPPEMIIWGWERARGSA